LVPSIAALDATWKSKELSSRVTVPSTHQSVAIIQIKSRYIAIYAHNVIAARSPFRSAGIIKKWPVDSRCCWLISAYAVTRNPFSALCRMTGDTAPKEQ